MKKLVESLVKSIIREVNKDYTIYFDLDDTLSNYTKNLRTSIYTDPETGEKRPFASKDTANDFDYWVRAELLPGAKGMVNFAQQNFNTVKILSAVPTLSKAKQEETGETYYKAPIEGKTKWLADNGFSLPAIWTNSGTAKRVYATPMTVLVDDKEENIKAFEKAGGKGILFTNAQDVIQKLKDILNPEIKTSTQPEAPVSEDVSYSDLFDIEDYADEKLDPIDIKIPDHFVDRVNDKRNKPSIKPEELYNFFDKLSDDKDDLIAMLNRGEEVVATDSQSKINIPLTKDKNSQLKSKVKTVAKTIMRKDNFQTTSPKLVFEKTQGDSIVCDGCGWTWKIADGGDDLYNCHKCGHDNTPKETNNFFEPIEDKQSELNISSEPTRVDYYKDHIQNVVPSDFKVEKQKDKIVVTPTPKHKQNLENNPEFKELLVSLTMHMMDNINIEPLPDLIFIEDDTQNAKDMLGRTAHYNHNDKTITLYTYGRHPKDILRSYAHEMIHHKQNLEGRLKNKINTQNINEDDYLKEIEEEAYRLGNGLLFREWENSL
jgi:predicted oxidoreductase (fatty acid repression mutant protein)